MNEVLKTLQEEIDRRKKIKEFKKKCMQLISENKINSNHMITFCTEMLFDLFALNKLPARVITSYFEEMVDKYEPDENY